jgi:two-component system chemotaxis response regulator CheB
MHTRDIVVIGTSAGGVETLKRLAATLPVDFPAAIFVVLHVPAHSPGYLPAILQKSGPLPASFPEDGMAFRPGQIYVAPPDHHLLLAPGRVRVVRGPKENRHRPAIDPLFRSAAWAYGPRVVGVILSGTLDDGAAGLWAVKSCGGVAVVQDPDDALYPEMPASALAVVDVDHTVPLLRLAPLLGELARHPTGSGRRDEPDPQDEPNPQDEPRRQDDPQTERLKWETEFALMERDIDDMKSLGEPSAFSCPSCHGPLWELHDGALERYRCHVGHGFSPGSLLAEQAKDVEQALYSALRALEENGAIARRIAARYGDQLPAQWSQHQQKAQEMDESAAVIRRLLAGRPVTPA